MAKKFGRFAGVLALVLIVAGGCGSPSKGNVSGKVTFRGQPLARGSIAYINQNGSVASGTVTEGSYHIANAPLGLAKITVTAHPAPPPMVRPDQLSSAPPVAKLKPFVPIPKRYQDDKMSGLTYTVVAGRQVHDIVLEP